MIELLRILDAYQPLERANREAVLATVVKTGGSTYRRPGARMLMSEDAWLAGAISGGCLEGDLLRKAWWRTAAGRPTIVEYESTGDSDDRFGLGCQGRIEVLLERVVPGVANPLTFLRGCTQRSRGVMATVISGKQVGERLLADEGGAVCTIGEPELAARVRALADDALATCPPKATAKLVILRGAVDGAEIFLELIPGPRRLVIFGGGYDVPPVARLARSLGWHVTVVEHRPVLAARADLAAAADRVVVAPAAEDAVARAGVDVRCAVVVMTHSYERDRALLPALFASGASYVGLLGPRRRADRILGELAQPPSAAELARLHAPIGLDVGAEGADEIALSIVAELHAVLAHRPDRSQDATEELRLPLERTA